MGQARFFISSLDEGRFLGLHFVNRRLLEGLCVFFRALRECFFGQLFLAWRERFVRGLLLESIF